MDFLTTQCTFDYKLCFVRAWVYKLQACVKLTANYHF